jgi:O-antigen/teichoic acid export membrane protein
LYSKYLKNISFTLAASIVAKALGAFSSFLIARILQPENFGLWITMILLVSYSPILSFGTVETLLKQLPFYRGKRELEIANQLENTVFTSIVISAIFTFVIGLVIVIGFGVDQANSIKIDMSVITISACLSFLSAFFYYRFLAYQNFKIVGMLESFRAIIYISLVVSFSYLWGLFGAAIGFFLTEISVCGISCVLSCKSHGKVKLAFDFRAIFNAVSIGLPITIFWWIFIVQGSVDRLISIYLLGREQTGYYGLGISIVSVIYLLPQSISRVFYPRMNEKLGEISNEKELYRVTVFPTRMMGICLSGIIGIALIFMPIIYNMLPKYLPGLAAGQILLLVSMFRLIMTNGINFLNATNRQNRLCLMVFISLFVSVISSYSAVEVGYGLAGLAVSTGVSGLFLFVLVWQSVFACMGFNATEQCWEIFELLVPFFVMATILSAGWLMIPRFLSQTDLSVFMYALEVFFAYSACIVICPLTRRWTIDIISSVFSNGHQPRVWP